MNLVGISSLWAKCADAFSPEAGARLFGFISAGEDTLDGILQQVGCASYPGLLLCRLQG
jgi:hypothetical protein